MDITREMDIIGTNLIVNVCECNVANRRISFSRRFDAALHVVWEAWTDARQLEKWWAPKPYKVETKDFDFRPGGHWLYVMGGKDKAQWAALKYNNIYVLHSFDCESYFANENGTKRFEKPESYWNVHMMEVAGGTQVDVVVTCDETEELQKLLDLGFLEGFKMSLNNLDDLLT